MPRQSCVLCHCRPCRPYVYDERHVFASSHIVILCQPPRDDATSDSLPNAAHTEDDHVVVAGDGDEAVMSRLGHGSVPLHDCGLRRRGMKHEAQPKLPKSCAWMAHASFSRPWPGQATKQTVMPTAWGGGTVILQSKNINTKRTAIKSGLPRRCSQEVIK